MPHLDPAQAKSIVPVWWAWLSVATIMMGHVAVGPTPCPSVATGHRHAHHAPTKDNNKGLYVAAHLPDGGGLKQVR